jgi:hypothetical protein
MRFDRPARLAVGAVMVSRRALDRDPLPALRAAALMIARAHAAPYSRFGASDTPRQRKPPFVARQQCAKPLSDALRSWPDRRHSPG